MPQGKSGKKMADFLIIVTPFTQQLICAIFYQNFEGEVEVNP